MCDYRMLSENRLSGQIPSTIGYMSGMINLSLQNNVFDNAVPTQINLLVNLRFL